MRTRTAALVMLMVGGLTSPVSADDAPPSPPPAAAPTPPEGAPNPDGEPNEEREPHPWHIELALFPMLTQQQIEGPNRDDLLTNDGGLSTALSVSYAPIRYIEPTLWMQMDVGSVRRAVYTRPDENGATAETQEIDGAYWEFWLAFMLRGRLGPAFAEAGWAPLILRNDTTRSDLPNVNGQTNGVFEGSRSVAWIFGGGASIPVVDNFDVTLRLQFRIRYLVSRGGEPLADEEENGQMTLWPFMGAHFHF